MQGGKKNTLALHYLPVLRCVLEEVQDFSVPVYTRKREKDSLKNSFQLISSSFLNSSFLLIPWSQEHGVSTNCCVITVEKLSPISEPFRISKFERGNIF